MKILLATDLYSPAVNGVVTSTLSLKKALEHLGHEVRVLTLAEEGFIDAEKDIYVVSSLNMNKVYPGARVRFFSDRSILKCIVAWGPDIIHTQSEFSTFRMAKLLTQELHIPIVHTYHTIYEDYTHYFSPSEKTGRKVVSVLTKRLLEDVEAVIAPTKKVGRMLDSYGVEQPITVIPTGIQLEKYAAEVSAESTAALRQRYKIPQDAFLLISLGRLGKEKNTEELLYFISLLKFDVHLLIVGDGPNRLPLVDYMKELGLEDRVSFAGMVGPNEVPLYYKSADVFVSASTSETQGLTYIEALASKLPALCRFDESIENVILNDETGFQYHSFKEFESCLYYLMHNQAAYQKMAKQGCHLAFEHFSSEAFGEQVEHVYKSTLHSFDLKQSFEINY